MAVSVARGKVVPKQKHSDTEGSHDNGTRVGEEVEDDRDTS